MTEISKYNLYQIIGQSNANDAETHYRQILNLKDYDKVLDYINQHFGETGAYKEFPYRDKTIIISKEKDEITCSLQDSQNTKIVSIARVIS